MDENLTRNQPGDLVGFFIFGSHWFRVDSGRSRVLSPRPKFGRIHRDLAQISSDNDKILPDLAQILKDLNKISLDLVDILLEFGWVFGRASLFGCWRRETELDPLDPIMKLLTHR